MIRTRRVEAGRYVISGTDLMLIHNGDEWRVSHKDTPDVTLVTADTKSAALDRLDDLGAAPVRN